MFSKSHSLLLVACGGSAIVALGCVSFASAGTVYQDNFARTGNLVGTSPSPVNSGAATWTGNFAANTVTATTDGSELVLSQVSYNGTAGGVSGAGYLPFTAPSSGTVTLSANMEAGALSTGNSGTVAIGFGNPSLTPTLVLASGTYNGDVGFYPNGYNNAAGQAQMKTMSSFSNGTFYNFSIDYNASTQTAQWSVDSGSGQQLAGDTYTYTTAPTINGVETSLSSNSADTVPLVAEVQNFQLTTAAVPEPATLGVFALGGMGLLLASRKRKARV